MPAWNAARAYDLSAIAEAAKNPPPPPGAASYTLELDQANFESTMQLSLKHPVVLELYSSKDKTGAVLTNILEELANEANGAFLLAKADIEVLPEVAQAFGIQAVPTVLGVIGGQLAPLFQGTADKQDVAAVLAQLLQAAQSAGITGRAQPVSVADVEDPRFAAADAAMEKGDFGQAVIEFDKILAATPGDPAAKTGKAQAAFLSRVQGLGDQAQVLAQAKAKPDDIQAQFAAADAELAGRQPDAAFSRLINLVKATGGDEREQVRLRLLELFETMVPGDPAVAKARRELMTSLF
ncbi:MAG: tetratricopeptide repeat protein [Propionibacteriaceae bacterium]|jgi:putative thioredoxin|nr:tetratricopeptide repeat protein [Propionibacteriaceae bacterium]